MKAVYWQQKEGRINGGEGDFNYGIQTNKGPGASRQGRLPWMDDGKTTDISRSHVLFPCIKALPSRLLMLSCVTGLDLSPLLLKKKKGGGCSLNSGRQDVGRE